MRGHVTSEQLNDLVDGLLEGAELEATEAHLGSCRSCRELLQELEGVLSELGKLPIEAHPEHDLWPEIRERLGPEEVEAVGGAAPPARILPFPTRPAERHPLRRRMSLTLPQLAAAAAVVALLSAGSMWWVLWPGSASLARGPAPAVSGDQSVLPASLPLDAAVTDLEKALSEGEDLLDPETLAVVRNSLATIDQAIAEARQALAEDPGSELLNRLLVSHQMAKLRLLQKATAGLIRA